MSASSALLDRLRAPGTVLLDAPRADVDSGQVGPRLYADPVRTLVARQSDDVPALLDALDDALARGHHVAGVLSYEAGDPEAQAEAGPAPLAWFGVYGPPETPAGLDDALATLAAPAVTDVAFGWTRAAYGERLDRVRAWIREGDVYQVNLTMPVRFRLAGDPLALYTALRQRQPVAYAAWLSLPDGVAVASVSPELFVRVDPVDGRRRIRTRPMKGTTARGRTPAEDDRLAEALASRTKDRAENLMIVDLLRNDLAQVATPGSVVVPALFATERHETLTQMTSTVEATLRPDASLGDVLRAAFPCGSVTGAPKRRAMQRIRMLEANPRGVYCGAIGAASPDGGAAFSVAIRTAVVHDGQGVYGVGSGVVWDSDADAEWAECALKARVLTDLAS